MRLPYASTLFRLALFGLLVAPAELAWAQLRPQTVLVVQAVQRQVVGSQRFAGTVMPLRHSIVGSAVDGRVEEFPINEGDRVQKGQKLAQLLTRTIEIEIRAAQAELQLRQHELAELKAGSRPEEVQEAEARLRRAHAVLDYAKNKFERAKLLFERKTIAADELQSTESAYLAADENHREAQAGFTLVKIGPRQEKIDQAQARVDSQAAVVERLEDIRSKYTVVAPFDGYVVAEHTEVGAWVSPGTKVAEIVELDQVDVTIPLLENYAPYVSVGSPAFVECEALPGQRLEGVVSAVVPQADPRSRTFPVKVRVANMEQGGSPVLKAGMFARVTLSVGTTEQATLVPKDALVLGGTQPVLFAVSGTSQADMPVPVRRVPVDLGTAEGDWVQVRGNLKPGEWVAVQGNERLADGQPVVARLSAVP